MAKKKVKKKINKKNPKTSKENEQQKGKIESGKDPRQEAHNVDSDPEPKDQRSQSYDDQLQDLMNPWRVLAVEADFEVKQSLYEILICHNTSEEKDELTTAAFSAITWMTTSMGYRLSRQIIDYLVIFWRYEKKELAAKAMAVSNTIRNLNLGGPGCPSPVIEKFVDTVDLILLGIKYPKHYNDESRASGSGEDVNHGVWVSLRENRIMEKIFYKVLLLEVLFSCPYLPGDSTAEETGVSVSKVAEFVAARYKGFTEEMDRLKAEIDELREEELENEEDEIVETSSRGKNAEDLATLEYKGDLSKKLMEMWKVDMFD